MAIPYAEALATVIITTVFPEQPRGGPSAIAPSVPRSLQSIPNPNSARCNQLLTVHKMLCLATL